MSTEKINFEKRKTYGDDRQLEVRFEGILKETTNLDKINYLLNQFMEDPTDRKNMVRNIAFLRTILKELEETLLVVSYCDSNGSQEFVEYENYHLSLYESNINTSTSTQDQISIKYHPDKGFDLSFTDNAGSTLKQVTDSVNRIYQLKNVRAIELDRDSKLLIEIYQLFYNENPDFSDKAISIRIQTMMSILAEFGISLGEDYGFGLLTKAQIPLSFNLEKKISKLFPLGEVVSVDEPIKFAQEAKNTIKIAGECIREAIVDEPNREKALITISQVIYAGRYELSSNHDAKELSKFTHCTTKEVESSLQLVKSIEKRIYQTD